MTRDEHQVYRDHICRLAERVGYARSALAIAIDRLDRAISAGDWNAVASAADVMRSAHDKTDAETWDGEMSR